MLEQTTNSDYPLEAYKILVDLVKHDEELSWKRNDFIIAINGGMLTILGLLYSSNLSTTPKLKLISLVMCLMGCIINILWFFISKRSEAFYNHWFEQLEYLEKKFLPQINIFQIADEFFSKGKIVLGDKPLKLDAFSRSIRMFTIVQVVTFILAIVWFALCIFLLSE